MNTTRAISPLWGHEEKYFSQGSKPVDEPTQPSENHRNNKRSGE